MRHWLTTAAIVVLMSLGASSSAQQTSKIRPAADAQAKANPDNSVGADVCTTCHTEEAKKFDSNPHGKLALEHGSKGVTCEGCHGPGKAHVESGGDAIKIFSFTKATAKQADDRCLDCHQGQHPNFAHTAHGEAKVSCTSCHSVHASKAPEHLLKVTEPDLCFQCHTDVKPQFAMPFHHKVNEGLMSCSDCHDPHGTFQDKMLKTAADQNAVCVKCHAETAGPFVYEHPPIKTEGCTSCHFPHGSPNPRLLTRNNVNSLCMQCHTASASFTAPGTPSFHNQANQYQACTVCHVEIHGSSASSVFFK